MRKQDQLEITVPPCGSPDCDPLIDRYGALQHAIDNTDLHISGLLPGERARVRVVHMSAHRAAGWAEIVERHGPPSVDRAEVRCSAYGRCGGCAWQHIASTSQGRFKRSRLRQALADVLPDGIAIPEVVPAPSSRRYRNRASYVARWRSGRVRLGAYAPRSHQWVGTEHCDLVVAAIARQCERLPDLLSQAAISVYHEPSQAGHLRYVIIRANRRDETLIALIATSTADRQRLQRAAELIAEDSSVSGVVWVKNDHPHGVLLTPAVEVLVGRGSLEETISGTRFELEISSFIQVNLAHSETLVSDLVADLDPAPGSTYLDLYCGVGALSFALARRGVRVRGIERNADAVEVARRAAAGLDPDLRPHFEARAAEEIDAVQVDGVIVNPPRRGLGSAGQRALLRIAAATLTYVSCDPDTLADDLRALQAGGYHVRSLRAYDLMPDTAQVETVVHLRRHAPGPREATD